MNDLWPLALQAAQDALLNMKTTKNVTWKMRYLTDPMNQYNLMVKTRLYGKIVLSSLDYQAEDVELLELYKTFRDMLIKSGMSEEDIISFYRFKFHPDWAMEYADLCVKNFNRLGAEFFKDCGGMLCSYNEFEASCLQEFLNRYR